MSQPVVNWLNLDFPLNTTMTGPVAIKNTELAEFCKPLSQGITL